MRAFMLRIFLMCLLVVATTASAQSVKDSLRYDSVPTRTTLVARRIPKLQYGGVPRYRHKASGYRIQVYTGTNNRKSKEAAHQLKHTIQQHFPELSVYVHFQSPRWICRVGDFASREDARRYASKIRAKRLTTELRIVATTVLLTY